MNMRVLKLLILNVILISSCGSDPLDVDVSDIKADPLKFQRIDQDLFALDTANLPEGMAAIRKKFGVITDCYLNNIICYAAPDSTDCYYTLAGFLTDHTMHGGWVACNEKFTGGFADQENEVSEAYKYFAYHFPERKLPKGVYIVFSGFNYNYFSCDGYYAIGMDWFLGKDNVFYEGLQWPMYQRRKLEPQYMASGFVRSWMMTEFPYNSEKNDVINRIIYEGKIMYLQKALLRNTPDSVITGYTQAQLVWSEANEAEMWAKMIEDKLVYSESEDDLNHMTMDAPFTPGFPRESPGRAGVWIGYRIVCAYMQQYPETTLEELMALNDGQMVLTRSKYKPKF